MSQISNQLPFHVTMHTAYLPWDELIGRLWWAELRVYHEEHVGKSRAKVDAINVMVTRGLGGVHITAFRAVELYHWLTRDIRETWRERWGQGREREREKGWGEILTWSWHGITRVTYLSEEQFDSHRKHENSDQSHHLGIFQSAWGNTTSYTHTHTLSLSHTHTYTYHLSEAPVSEDVSSVDEPIEHLCRLLH